MWLMDEGFWPLVSPQPFYMLINPKHGGLSVVDCVKSWPNVPISHFTVTLNRTILNVFSAFPVLWMHCAFFVYFVVFFFGVQDGVTILIRAKMKASSFPLSGFWPRPERERG